MTGTGALITALFFGGGLAAYLGLFIRISYRWHNKSSLDYRRRK